MIISYKFHTQLKKRQDAFGYTFVFDSFLLIKDFCFQLNENSKHFVTRKLQP